MILAIIPSQKSPVVDSHHLPVPNDSKTSHHAYNHNPNLPYPVVEQFGNLIPQNHQVHTIVSLIGKHLIKMQNLALLRWNNALNNYSLNPILRHNLRYRNINGAMKKLRLNFVVIIVDLCRHSPFQFLLP